jgi:hypothetical protein
MSLVVHVRVMVEVFKTNVVDKVKAKQLIDEIQMEFVDSRASFDLEDCDRVLVVRSLSEEIDPSRVINLLHRFGYDAHVLPDQ